jgi:hypothetical protein
MASGRNLTIHIKFHGHLLVGGVTIFVFSVMSILDVPPISIANWTLAIVHIGAASVPLYYALRVRIVAKETTLRVFSVLSTQSIEIKSISEIRKQSIRQSQSMLEIYSNSLSRPVSISAFYYDQNELKQLLSYIIDRNPRVQVRENVRTLED